MKAVPELETSVPVRDFRNHFLLAGTTLFLSASLLFWFEPMVGKMMLPFLGGAASVWITCLLFFQLMLLAGYGYAHVLERWTGIRTQVLVHGIMMLAVFVFLPIRFTPQPDAFAVEHPAPWLLWQLIKSVGIPFAVVSTTAPLLQNWLTKTPAGAARDPYFLYAISNAGSLIALLAYPLIIEPRIGVRTQSLWWFAGYGALSLMVLAAAGLVWKTARKDAAVHAPEQTDAPLWRSRLFWLAAAFVPSALMSAVTNHILLNLASVPFLWILPLAVYLITFMLAFGHRIRLSYSTLSKISPVIFLLLFPLSAASTSVAAKYMWFLVAGHLVLLMTGALLCHTSLSARRPAPRHLTEFYVWIAFGGALGAAFTAVVAPVVFKTVLEYPLLVAFLAFFREPREGEEIGGLDLIWPAAL